MNGRQGWIAWIPLVSGLVISATDVGLAWCARTAWLQWWDVTRRCGQTADGSSTGPLCRSTANCSSPVWPYYERWHSGGSNGGGKMPCPQTHNNFFKKIVLITCTCMSCVRYLSFFTNNHVHSCTPLWNCWENSVKYVPPDGFYGIQIIKIQSWPWLHPGSRWES